MCIVCLMINIYSLVTVLFTPYIIYTDIIGK